MLSSRSLNTVPKVDLSSSKLESPPKLSKNLPKLSITPWPTLPPPPPNWNVQPQWNFSPNPNPGSAYSGTIRPSTLQSVAHSQFFNVQSSPAYRYTTPNMTTTTTTTRRPIVRPTSTLSSLPSQTISQRKPKSRNKSARIDSKGADRCLPNRCSLPYCKCASANIPGELKANEIPQLVMITFDDSINDLNWDIYREIFPSRVNPNGCPILGTFYVSHEWTDYSQVQTMYSEGHEMASHSIT